MEPKRVESQIGSRKMVFESGLVAKQASGAALVQIEDTIVLAAVVGGPPRGLGYEMVPLTVDYRERIAAAGKFPGGFIKREGRPSTKETLTARQIDRPIRPLFPDYMDTDVVISVTVLSADGGAPTPAPAPARSAIIAADTKYATTTPMIAVITKLARFVTLRPNQFISVMANPKTTSQTPQGTSGTNRAAVSAP